MKLQVLRDFGHLALSELATATIRNVFSITMSPVMDVAITTTSGSEARAVLKLYDRRFGTDLRQVRYEDAPLTVEDDDIYSSSVRRAEIDGIVAELDEEKRTEDVIFSAWHYLDGTAHGRAKYETALWRETNEQFDCETEAYERLSNIQHKSIPQMYAHVRVITNLPTDALQLQDSKYFEVKGILLEYIPSYNLTNIAVSPMAPDPEDWQRIVQSAVDIARDFNMRGIIVMDCQPRNVIVDERTQMPFLIDLAQCVFKDKLFKSLPTSSWWDPETEEWEYEHEFWKMVSFYGNHRAIGAVMDKKLQETKGIKLDLRYPSYIKTMDDIRQGRELRSTAE